MENICPKSWSKIFADQAKQTGTSSQETFLLQQVLGQWNSLMKEMLDATGSGGSLESASEEKAISGN